MIYIQNTGYIFGYIEVTFFENVTQNVTFQEKRHKKTPIKGFLQQLRANFSGL